MTPDELIALRLTYTQASLRRADVLPDPVEQLRGWLADAAALYAAEGFLEEPNAMTLATAGPNGAPSARTVLLRHFDHHGLVFYTHYTSQKGQELAYNPQAALLFYWGRLQRQVRLTGRVGPIPKEASQAYFETRPRGSQIAAWASSQSQVIPNRAYLEAQEAHFETLFADQPDIPLPPNWGGYRLTPDSFEFWQGRPNRLHDRLRYRLQSDGTWLIERLSP